MAEATLDQFLDALEAVVMSPLDPFEEEPGTMTDVLVLGRCSADGYAMLHSPDHGTWRPHSVGQGVPCPADRRTYIWAETLYLVGLCQPATFERWKAGKR